MKIIVFSTQSSQTSLFSIAKFIQKINSKVEILFILNSKPATPLKGFKYEVLDLPTDETVGKLDFIYYTKLKQVLTEKFPEILVFCNNYCAELITDPLFSSLKNVLILNTFSPETLNELSVNNLFHRILLTTDDSKLYSSKKLNYDFIGRITSSENRAVKRAAREIYSLLGLVPNQIVIEMTSRCNQNCSFCFNQLSYSTKDDQDLMDTEYIKKILVEAAKVGVPVVRFSGGEPLLRDDIYVLMDYAHKLGLGVWLNTNGTLITEKNIKQLEKYVDDILIPFNSYDSHSEIEATGKDFFKKRISALKILIQGRIPYVRCDTVATSNIIENLDKVAQLLQEIGVDNWIIVRPMPITHDSFKKKELATLLDKLEKINEHFPNKVRIANAVPFCSLDPILVSRFAIGAESDDGHTRIIVDPKGFCKPSYTIIKNIGNPLDLLSCWNHEFMKNMRNLTFVPIRCKHCKYISCCKGGSRYTANFVHNSYFAEDPLMGASIYY